MPIIGMYIQFKKLKKHKSNVSKRFTILQPLRHIFYIEFYQGKV